VPPRGEPPVEGPGDTPCAGEAEQGSGPGWKATCFFPIKDDLVNAGARYEDREVVRDGNLVTSRKPEDLPAFCRSIIQVLTEAKT